MLRNVVLLENVQYYYHFQFPTMENQVIEQRYLDKDEFFALLARLFSNGDYSVEVSVVN